ncbi:MAG TPA: hypothetical protein VLT33_49855 [Labilithrix sp.]|nr:hypothetical protein [Labilithrix sp.]
MKNKSRVGAVLGAIAMATSLVYLACDSSDNAVKEQNPTLDSGKLGDGAPVPDAGPSPDGALPDGDCFPNPTTHFEIINACTDAVKITKNPTLPLLLADGGLPPLP